MTLGLLCVRRVAIVAALCGGFMIAVAGAGICSQGIVTAGSVCLGVVQSVARFFGL